MTETDLQSKIQQAKKSMSGDRLTSSELLAENLVKLRKNTLSFSGDTSSDSANNLSIEDLNKKREEAKKAMESFEQKKRREAKERNEQEAKLMAKKIEEMKRAREELEKKRLNQSSTEEQQKIQQKIELEKTYQKNLTEAKAEIDIITNSNEPDIQTYRTLKTDFSNEVQTKGLTMSKIALEEEARRRLSSLPREKNTSIKKNILIIFISLTLIIISALAIYTTFLINNPKTSNIAPINIQSIAFADKHIELKVNNKTPEQLIDEIKNIIQKTNSTEIINIYPTSQVEVDGQNKVQLLSSQDVLESLGISTPISFYHFLQPEMMLGVSGGEEKNIFFIFKTRSFENTFDVLLREEKIIVNSLLRDFSEEITNFYSTSFRDKLLNNIDTRFLSNGTSTIAVYGFIDKSTLVVTTTDEAFTNILRAYLTPRPSL